MTRDGIAAPVRPMACCDRVRARAAWTAAWAAAPGDPGLLDRGREPHLQPSISVREARPRAGPTILLGGLAVAVLDIANAMTFWALYRGTAPRIILQSVAAGLLGRSAYTGGTATACLGAALHLFISCGIAAVFYVGSTRWPSLLRRPFLSGAAYGAIVYGVMNYVVIPLSQAKPGPFRLPWFLANFIGHLVLVGPPVALIARGSARKDARSG